MLPTNIEEVAPEHITNLVTEKVSERRTLEYKEQLPGGGNEEKKEFLADVCSFANLNGGDLIYGIRDERDVNGRSTGIPESIVGLGSANFSAERERLEWMIRDGIRPRIASVQTRELEIAGQGTILLLRIGTSWIKPHMVTFRGASRFYSRHSTGKYQLDVQEIGQAFAAQRSIGEQLRNWRIERITTTLSGEGPVSLGSGPRILLHFVPAEAVGGRPHSYQWPPSREVRNILRTSSLSAAISRFNADGYFLCSYHETAKRYAAYALLFRTGAIEYADAYVLNGGITPLDQIPSRIFEDKMVGTFGNAIDVMNHFGVSDPIYFSCVLVGVKGMRLSRGSLDDDGHTFDRQVVQSPEIQVDRSEQAPFANTLLPIVNSIWQANGYEQTPWTRNWTG